MILDINDFKQINDTYGHLAGDRALKQIAAMYQNKRAGTTSGTARQGPQPVLYDHTGRRFVGARGRMLQRSIVRRSVSRRSVHRRFCR